MKPSLILRSFLFAAGSSLLAVSSASAQTNGTWVGNANWWSDPASWVGGITPTGTDGTANFTGVNITGNISKPLGGAGDNRTIGNIIFTDATTSSHNLTLSGNTLTLDVTSGQPNIDVTQSDRTLTISSVVAGNDGLQKSGLGTLTLSNANTFTGNITISAGTLSANFNGGGGANPTATALGNTQTVGRTATISNGAFLRFNIGDVMGNGGGTPLLTIIANGGTILNGGNFINSLGPVQLNGGTLNSSGTGDGFKLTGTVTVGGSAVSTIQANASGFVGSTGVITYDVADAIAGSGSDLDVTARLSGIFGSGGVTKTGAGTMTLSNQNTYTGLTRIDAGTLALAHATNTLADTGAVNVNGGTLALGSFTDTVGAVTLTSGSITGSGAGTLTGTSYAVESGTVSAKLGGTAVALTKTTAGTVTISSDNSSGGYTGATNVNGGKLTVSSTGNINSTSGVSIGAGEFNYNASTALSKPVTFSGTGGTLSGSGTISPTVTISSGNTLAIGNSVGQMNFGDGLILAGTTVMEIDGTAGAGLTGGNDFANVTGGTLTYGGTMTLDLGMIFGAGSYTWNLFDFAGADLGTFSTITLADQYSGSLLDGNSNGIWDLTSGSNTWQFTESSGVLGLTVVPEPSAALLVGLGLLALLRRRR